MKTTFLKLGVQISWLAFFIAVSCQKENMNNQTLHRCRHKRKSRLTIIIR